MRVVSMSLRAAYVRVHVASWWVHGSCYTFKAVAGSCHKYHFCRDKHVFVATKACLQRRNFCRDKIIFVVKNVLPQQQQQQQEQQQQTNNNMSLSRKK